METKKYKCYACGVETPEGDFIIKQGDLDNDGYGLCRSCVSKGISVSKVSYTKLREPAPVTQAEYEEACISFSENFNAMINGLIPFEVASAWKKLNFAVSKIYRWNLERTKSPLYVEVNRDEE